MNPQLLNIDNNLQSIFDRLENYNLPLEVETIVYLLKNYSFRISECLRIERKDLLPNFQISVKLSKCKDYQIIRDEKLYNTLLFIFSRNNINKFVATYKDVYYYIKKNIPEYSSIPFGKNTAVTHMFRYINSRKVKHLRDNPKITQAVLHHQSKESQKYYLKEKKL